MQLDVDTKSKIEGLIQKNRVMLFMKGSKSFPQCGFSAAVVGILKELAVPFETANVLADPALRDGIKAFSDWPTIPQLYVDGQFVGGCDIVREMHASGELAKTLGVKVEPAAPPSITVTPAAVKAFQDAAEPGEDKLRLEIDAGFKVDLFFGPPQAGDLEVASNGITLAIDPASAKRANGVLIDYVDGPAGAGFKIENPNAPPTVRQLSARELDAMLKGGEKVTLIDVRTERERDIARIEGALWLDKEGKDALDKLDKNAVVVFHCHHGMRSQRAAEAYLKEGFRRVYNLAGGIDAWSRDVDPKMPTY
ncbi:MAG TPA: Grx4 family monothiol glutaredoxin [Polyangiaceae bacterium]|nr:Grx4 family monothiol glutaredoxin [Polyangiaceae bacterium]